MKVSEAIVQANNLRINTISEEQKVKWLNELDFEIAELMDVEAKPIVWPEIDDELLVTSPHDRIYVLWLICMYDYYNEEISLYQNDMTLYNNAIAEWKSWLRRHKKPVATKNRMVM